MSDTIDRPEGLMHRSFSGEFSRVRMEGEADDAAARYEFIASTDGPVEIWRSTFEVLDHGPKAVRMDWFKSGNAPVLWMHDRADMRGVVESAKLEGGKLIVTVRVSASQTDLIRDLDDKIVRNVSIGYRIHAEDTPKRDVDSETGVVTKTTFRVTDWEPQEVSFVTIPADKDAGFRSENEALVKSRVRAFEEKAPAATATHQRTNTMSENATATISVTESDKHRTDAVTAERLRVAGINAAANRARETGFGDFATRAQEAIDKGEALESFQRHVLDNMKRTEPVTTEQLGLSAKEQRRYSLLNVLDGLNEGDPKRYEFEAEVSRAAQAANGHGDGSRMTVPVDILLRGWTPKNPALAARMGLTDRERTLISVSASSANSSNLVPSELMADMYIESLREATALLAGATILPGLVGDVDIPIELTNPLFYWVGEDAEPTEGAWTASQIAFRFKTIGARIPMTRRSLKQTTPNIEAVIAANLRRGAALGIEKKAFVGASSSTQPGGILNTAGIGDVTTSSSLTLAHLIELRTDVGAANAPLANCEFFTSSRGVGIMRGTAIVSGDAKRVAEWGPDGRLYCEGRPVNESNLVPDNLGVGTNKTAILFGDRASVYVGMWGGLELAVDTSTKAATGGKVLRAFQDCDIQIPQPARWSAIQDL
jgi:HK97 family phage major capsid protein